MNSLQHRTIDEACKVSGSCAAYILMYNWRIMYLKKKISIFGLQGILSQGLEMWEEAYHCRL
jgi:hypothetical protein